MRRSAVSVSVSVAAGAAALTWLTVAVGAPPSSIHLTQIGRLPFPDRGYVIDLPAGTSVGPGAVKVVENGRRVTNLRVEPLGQAGVSYGTVLALDASDSMTGAPIADATAAARAFVVHRANGQQIGVVSFNSSIQTIQPLSGNSTELRQALRTPHVAYGTRIFDALARSLSMLASRRISSGSIVLLSDGTDVGSAESMQEIVGRARATNTRIFTVGLRSGAFDPNALRAIARETGGSYVEASSSEQLSGVYEALGQRLAGEYVVQYRSAASPHARVEVSVAVNGVGAASTQYTAPTPSGLAPYHRSLVSRFFLSPATVLLVSLFVAALFALAVVALFRSRTNDVVKRVTEFTGAAESRNSAGQRLQEAVIPAIQRNVSRSRFIKKLDARLEIARMDVSAKRVVALTAASTLLAIIVLAVIAPIFAVLGLLVPLGTRAYIERQLRKIRDAFAEQLPPNLQVLASSLRVGHSLIGSLTVVVENAHEPSQSELQRILVDEQLGVPLEEAIRRVAERMASRDLEQVALLAELQRTAGGNAAEVLDTIVETLRDRVDLRRLVRTLTAQGRLARWILSALPPLAGLLFLALDPTAVTPLFTTGLGQGALVFAALLVVAGSLVIQKIINIKV